LRQIGVPNLEVDKNGAFGPGSAGLLFVQNGTKNRDHEVGEVGSVVVELKPADNAMFGQIFPHSSFRDAQVRRELRLNRVCPAPGGPAAKKIGNGDAESLTGFHVVVAGEIGIRKKKDARTSGSRIGLVELYRSAGEEAPKLQFEEREPRR
jgi:hypothetical protein